MLCKDARYLPGWGQATQVPEVLGLVGQSVSKQHLLPIVGSVHKSQAREGPSDVMFTGRHGLGVQ